MRVANPVACELAVVATSTEPAPVSAGTELRLVAPARTTEPLPVSVALPVCASSDSAVPVATDAAAGQQGGDGPVGRRGGGDQTRSRSAWRSQSRSSSRSWRPRRHPAGQAVVDGDPAQLAGVEPPRQARQIGRCERAATDREPLGLEVRVDLRTLRVRESPAVDQQLGDLAVARSSLPVAL